MSEEQWNELEEITESPIDVTVANEVVKKKRVPRRKQKVKKSLAQKLLDCQRQVQPVIKDGTVGGRYKFASANAILEAVREICLGVGVLLIADYRNFHRDGENRCVIEVRLRVFDTDNPESEPIEVSAFGEGVDNQDKGAGKAQTYSLKYALRALFLLKVSDEEDPDLTQGPEANFRPKKKRPKTNLSQGKAADPTKTELESLRELLIDSFASISEAREMLLTRFGAEKLSDLSKPQVGALISELGEL